MARSRGLGRGLGALIPADETDVPPGTTYRELPVVAIVVNRFQPRTQFDEESLAELTASVAALGVLQPVLVRPTVDSQFELIAGERRWRAAQQAGLEVIPAIVRDVEDHGALAQAVVENVHRQDLNALEEAAAYRQLMEDFGLTQSDVAQRVGRSRSAVANTVRLLQLPAEIQMLVVDGTLTAGHARALLAVEDAAAQRELAEAIVAQGMTVRDVEQWIKDAADGSARDADPSPKPASPGETKPAALLELERLLEEHLDTRVSVTLNDRRGRIQVDFATIEDLERIYRAMRGAPVDAEP